MMKRILSFFLLLLLLHCADGQTKNSPASKNKTATGAKLFNGQWRGFFNSNGDIVTTGEGSTEYVLELEVTGALVSGFSYSYFENRSYYTICSVDGRYDKKTKTVTVTETARIKGLTPPGWQDCLQTHILTYQKDAKGETLNGRWKMAPGQIGDCGFGRTTLVRRMLKKQITAYNKPKTNSTVFTAPKKVTPKAPAPTDIAINKPKTPTPKIAPKQDPVITAPSTDIVVTPQDKKPYDNTSDGIKKDPTPDIPDDGFEKRYTDILKTVEIHNETIRIDLYDNGVIDGDSISLFYNDRLLLAHQRLSEKPITITLNVNTKTTNELTMYAENLGEIPPNTALMIVTDGTNRYEVPIKSDLKSSGVIRFVYAPKSQ
ncbi:hypothetical protein [Ferruginibacter albus]|uniref:hypothetical protein n=1 Tax=Ferruginibacter albus TaxID=2875540 RepID=UPI001CC43C06|nr:hypothetical protein [Ferruginibacter albus]UAY51173.1 hypothetical protein K9M53_11295 [Ferruginibacter albus]